MELEHPENGTARRTLGALLEKPYGQIQRSSYGKLENLGHRGIRIAHSAVFRNLDPGGSRITDLAAKAGMAKQSMAYLLENLRDERYVEMEQDPDDGRAKRVVLTPEGERAVASLRQLSDELEGQLAEKFGDDWVQDLRGKLTNLDKFLRATTEAV